MAFKTETQVTLRPGERATIRSPYGWTYRLTHLGISQYDALNRQVTAATLEGERDGKRLGIMTTEKRREGGGRGRAAVRPPAEGGIRRDPGEGPCVGQPAKTPPRGPALWGRWGAPPGAGRPPPPGPAGDNDAAIQAIEKQLKCTCGCNQDVYTCRTTDFNCTTSPAMHQRVLQLADHGKTAQEIIDQFVREHGQQILMAPPRRGFNLAGHFLPHVLIPAAEAVLVVAL